MDMTHPIVKVTVLDEKKEFEVSVTYTMDLQLP